MNREVSETGHRIRFLTRGVGRRRSGDNRSVSGVDRSLAVRAALIQLGAVAAISIVLALGFPRSFFEDWGWLSGPVAWIGCARCSLPWCCACRRHRRCSERSLPGCRVCSRSSPACTGSGRSSRSRCSRSGAAGSSAALTLPERPEFARNGTRAALLERAVDHVAEDRDDLLGLTGDGERGPVDLLERVSCSGGCRVISGVPSAAAWPASKAAFHCLYCSPKRTTTMSASRSRV